MRSSAGKAKTPSPQTLGIVKSELASLAPRYALSLRSKSLHLSMLGLFKVPEHVFTLLHLVRLDLGHNELEELSPAVGTLASLEQLWVNNNPVARLPREIQFCKKLKVLDLRETSVADVPRELGRLRSLVELDLGGTPYAAELAQRALYRGPNDTFALMEHLDVQDKRAVLCGEMFERACAGVYREVADAAEVRERISDLVAAVCDEFAELADLRNVVRNCDRLLPADVSRDAPDRAARKIRTQFTSLRRENDKKRLSAELELKMRAMYYDAIDPAAVEGYIHSIYVAGAAERALELEDIQFLIKNAQLLMPKSSEHIDGIRVRQNVWKLQQQLTDERQACRDDVCTALVSVYPDTEPNLVDQLATNVCEQFKRDRFASKKELGELKKLAADASVLCPAEFNLADPKQIRAVFRQRELDHAMT